MRLLAFALLAITFVVGCSTKTLSELPPAGSTSSANTAETDSAESSVDRESKVFVIDVRSKEEWDTGHVEQATHIPHTEIADRIAEVTEDKNAKIVVYCAVGGRAGKAKSTLNGLGFTDVENGGGYDDVENRFK